MAGDGGVRAEQEGLLDGKMRERVLDEDAARVQTDRHVAALARQRLHTQI